MKQSNRSVLTGRGGYALSSDEKILSIIETINSEGQRPTVKSVRERLGGGSNYRIQQSLKDWWESRKPTQLKREIRISDTLSQVITTEFEQARSESAAEALTELAEIKSQLDESNDLLGETEQQRDELELLNAELHRSHDELQSVAMQHQQRIEQLAKEEKRLHEQAQSLTQQLATSSATQQMQQERNVERANELQQQLEQKLQYSEQAIQRAMQSEQRAQKAEQNAAVNAAKTESAAEAKNASLESLAKLEKFVEQQNLRIEHLQTRLDSTQEKAAAAAQDHAGDSARLKQQLISEQNKNSELTLRLANKKDTTVWGQAKQGSSHGK